MSARGKSARAAPSTACVFATAAVRVWTSSFSKTCSSCVRTVWGDTPRIAATSLFVRPRATQRSTSDSRGVRRATPTLTRSSVVALARAWEAPGNPARLCASAQDTTSVRLREAGRRSTVGGGPRAAKRDHRRAGLGGSPLPLLRRARRRPRNERGRLGTEALLQADRLGRLMSDRPGRGGVGRLPGVRGSLR